MATPATVWLLGMMGAGKTAVGRALALRLERPFLDSDQEVEREAGAPVAEIFRREGEAGFRAREAGAVSRCAGRGAVVALGGGAPTRAPVREELAREGLRVYLSARAETLLERLGEAGERPLLAGLAPEARLTRVRELLAEREPHYAGADLRVETDGLTVPQVAEWIAGRLAEPAPARAGEAR